MYNRIPFFEEQQHTVDLEVLHTLGHVFVKHHLQDQFGICLLHRHQELRLGHAMTYHTNDQGDDICQEEEVGLHERYPCSFFLDESRSFLPFEYSRKPVQPAKDSFLDELAQRLLYFGIQDVLGFTYLAPSRRPMYETILPDGQGTISTKLDCEIDLNASNSVVTEWAVLEEGDGIRMRAMKACVKDEARVHDNR